MSVFKEQRLCHTMSSPLPPIIMLPPRLLVSSSNRMARLVLNRARVIVTVKRMVELAATCEGLLGPMGAVASSDGEHCAKFRSDEVLDGTSCGAKHDGAMRFDPRRSRQGPSPSLAIGPSCLRFLTNMCFVHWKSKPCNRSMAGC